MDDDTLIYDEIEMDPLDVLFDKLYSARGGEMVLVHIPPHSKRNKRSATCFSILNSKNSALLELLPIMIKDMKGKSVNE